MVTQKRGVATPFLFGLVLAVLVGTVFWSVVGTFTDQNEFNKFAVAKDVALFLDVAQATPHDLQYEYPEIVYGSNIIITDDTVSVVPLEDDLTDVGSLVASQYPYDSGRPYPVEETRVSASGFTLVKTDEGIVLVDEVIEQEELVQDAFKQSRKDLLISVQVEEREEFSDKQFLEQLQNSLTGRLTTRSFSLGSVEESNLKIALSLQEDNAIYHSSSIETKELAQATRTLLLAQYTFTIVQGSKSIEDNTLFIEFSLGKETQQQMTQDDMQVFAQAVVNAIETIYE